MNVLFSELPKMVDASTALDNTLEDLVKDLIIRIHSTLKPFLDQSDQCNVSHIISDLGTYLEELESYLAEGYRATLDSLDQTTSTGFDDVILHRMGESFAVVAQDIKALLLAYREGRPDEFLLEFFGKYVCLRAIFTDSLNHESNICISPKHESSIYR